MFILQFPFVKKGFSLQFYMKKMLILQFPFIKKTLILEILKQFSESMKL